MDVGKDLAVEGKCAIAQLSVHKSLEVEGRTACANVEVMGMLQVCKESYLHGLVLQVCT